ncbi:hypothetical protein ABE493_16525, partial [Stenotrophomonas terrae]|uniref:hypothetical protein n=1 Tax=Stenotrophomonas terrae TaxID=405446 RepID=UPI0032094187
MHSKGRRKAAFVFALCSAEPCSAEAFPATHRPACICGSGVSREADIRSVIVSRGDLVIHQLRGLR